MRYIKYLLSVLLFVGLFSVASAQSGPVGLFNFFKKNQSNKRSQDYFDDEPVSYHQLKEQMEQATKLPGYPDPKKWPYPRPTDSNYEKKYKKEVSSIQNSYWGSFNSLEQQRQILTGELARCLITTKEMSEVRTKP